MSADRNPPAAANPVPPGPRWPVVLLACALAGVLLTFAQRWHASILDRYETRQLQTALSTYWMQREGFRLDYLTPLFGPPWSVPMEFPTYQAIVAGLASLCGASIEQTGRFVSVAAYLAALPAAGALLGIAGLPRPRRAIALTVILSTPVYLFYPRTFMIETTALCLALWFLVALHRALTSGRGAWLALAAALAVLGALTKITTFLVYGVPAAALFLLAWRENRAAGRVNPFALFVRAAIPVALALGVTLWWIARGDALKHSNPYTGFLASTELRQWNYGTLALRLDPAFWLQLWQNLTHNVLSEGALALAALAAAFAAPRARWAAAAAGAGFFAGPLVFANLYHVHDYYFAANALLLTGAAGLLLASAWDNPAFPRAARFTALAGTLVLQYHAFDRGYHYHYWKEAPPPPDLAAIVRECVPADDVVLISGADWNPLLPYYTQRRAVMVAGGRDNEPTVLEDVVRRLPPRRIGAMLLVGDYVRQDAALIRARVARFGLAARPFATSGDADLYLPSDAVYPAALRLAGRSFGDARVLLAASAPLAIPNAREQSGAVLALPVFSPAPARARSQFGITAATVDGAPAALAHAPSEITFTPPASAQRFTAVVGLPANTYANSSAATDGIVVEIFLEQFGGLQRLLVRRELQPSTRAADRGPQELSYDHGEPFAGNLVFAIGPGPAGNNAYDQAYWARIDIR